jgi:hypothetical protein
MGGVTLCDLKRSWKGQRSLVVMYAIGTACRAHGVKSVEMMNMWGQMVSDKKCRLRPRAGCMTGRVGEVDYVRVSE